MAAGASPIYASPCAGKRSSCPHTHTTPCPNAHQAGALSAPLATPSSVQGLSPHRDRGSRIADAGSATRIRGAASAAAVSGGYPIGSHGSQKLSEAITDQRHQPSVQPSGLLSRPTALESCRSSRANSTGLPSPKLKYMIMWLTLGLMHPPSVVTHCPVRVRSRSIYVMYSQCTAVSYR